MSYLRETNTYLEVVYWGIFCLFTFCSEGLSGCGFFVASLAFLFLIPINFYLIEVVFTCIISPFIHVICYFGMRNLVQLLYLGQVDCWAHGHFLRFML